MFSVLYPQKSNIMPLFDEIFFRSFIVFRRIVLVCISICLIKMSFSFFAYQKKSCRQVKKIWLKTQKYITATTIFFCRKPLIVYAA